MSEQSSSQNPQSPHAAREEKILAFWKEKGVFEKSLKKEAPKGDFTFYDGPPFATGSPHYGHILAGTIKDVIPRWKTMQGYRVRRRWGWDCHGLPVENLIEKELGLKSKKDIITYGIGKFNDAAKASVMRYADEWRTTIPRLGRFVDMENDYRTMDATYTESVWWIFKTLYDKGLIYEGFKSMNLCPRCETTLSNFEVAQGYKDITDISVYAKFKLVAGQKIAGKDLGDANSGGGVFILAWTTTPWTLPGNAALAVGANIDYCLVKLTESANNSNTGQFYIVAKSRLEATFKDKKYDITNCDVKGSDLVGLSYEPIFNYYAKDATLKNRENGWKVYDADFVTTEDGTGIVHIAPAFGADDYALSLKYNIPFIQHVNIDGTFKKEVTDFSGQVKPKPTDEDKNAHQKSDIEVIKWLAHNGRLFEKEKLVHSYPHCWRCDTPLLNYATSSWFVKVTDLKDKLVKENQKVTWVPPEVGEGRFGNWLMGARDWAISRSRFWGAPIPVWRIERQKEEGNKENGKMNVDELVVIGSVDDVKKFSKAKNTYYVMRHGESENNIRALLNSDVNNVFHLTEKGKAQVAASAKNAAKIKFDLIIASPLTRTQETAQIVAETIGLQKEQVITDPGLHEMDMGEWEGKDMNNFNKELPFNRRLSHGPVGGESYGDTKRRVGNLLYQLENKYAGKTILLVTHAGPGMMLLAAAAGYNEKQTLEKEFPQYIGNAEIRPLDFVPLPHNADHELDLHRPFIDDIDLRTTDGAKLTRVPDVFDCWFESGAMPYGEAHYPFEKGNKLGEEFDPKSGIFKKSRGYPADFIAEGLDQTRGWFYSMLVLGVALFGKTSYKKVIVNGLVLAEDGEKMSKSKKNFPDPMIIVNKYGADSLRYYLMSSPVVRSQDLRFSEKGVDEITKKLVNRLLNVVSFYEMYVEKGEERKVQVSSNVLDRWIIARLNETIHAVTAGLEAGELDRASRPFMDLVDDLSTWYLRRSRDRFKGDDVSDKQAALATTKFVLIETAKILAPFMPFLAEDIYLRVADLNSTGSDSSIPESVHLTSWSTLSKIDVSVSENMEKVQRIASQGLDARTTAKINVRQPLQSLKTKEAGFDGALAEQFIALIKDEVNVKEVIFAAKVENNVELDLNITPTLKEEGTVRELIRMIQDMRKEKGLNVNDKATIMIETDSAGKSLIEKNKEVLIKTTSLKSIEWGSVEGEMNKAGEVSLKIRLS